MTIYVRVIVDSRYGADADSLGLAGGSEAEALSELLVRSDLDDADETAERVDELGVADSAEIPQSPLQDRVASLETDLAVVFSDTARVEKFEAALAAREDDLAAYATRTADDLAAYAGKIFSCSQNCLL